MGFFAFAFGKNNIPSKSGEYGFVERKEEEGGYKKKNYYFFFGWGTKIDITNSGLLF